MTAPEHSSLPWHDDGFAIMDANGKMVRIYGARPQFPEEEDHRRFIIRTANSHDALIAAAKEALQAFSTDPPWPHHRNAAIAELKAAIATAEESTS